MLWGHFDGRVRATVRLGKHLLRIDRGTHWTVPAMTGSAIAEGPSGEQDFEREGSIGPGPANP